MCATMNNVDEIGTLQENKELDNLINSQEMKDLDDLMGAIEDGEHYYTEIFDTLMYEQVTCWFVSLMTLSGLCGSGGN